MAKKKYIKIKNIKIKATDIAKAQGYDLRTKKGKQRVEDILSKGIYKRLPAGINLKKIKKLMPDLKEKKYINYYDNIFKKFKFNNEYNKVEKMLKKFNKSKKLKGIEAELIESWDGDIGANLKKYIDRFTPTERDLFNKIIGKMSNKEIERRFAQYATMQDITDLSFLYYPNQSIKKNKKGKKSITDTADEMLADDKWRLDTLKKYSEIFLETATNEKEYNKILKVFNQIADAHSEFYDD